MDSNSMYVLDGHGKSAIKSPSETLPQPQPFDENNAKYWCLCKRVHIRTAARAVAICLVIGILCNIFFSFTRSPTVIAYSWLLATFSVGVYGSLIYAVFKEKRNFTLPFLVFQGIFVVMLGILFLAFMLCSIFSSNTLISLAIDLGDVHTTDHVHTMTAGVRSFVIIAMIIWVMLICTQCWYFEIIYRFYQYLEDRETSFNFNFEPSFPNSV